MTFSCFYGVDDNQNFKHWFFPNEFMKFSVESFCTCPKILKLFQILKFACDLFPYFNDVVGEKKFLKFNFLWDYQFFSQKFSPTSWRCQIYFKFWSLVVILFPYFDDLDDERIFYLNSFQWIFNFVNWKFLQLFKSIKFISNSEAGCAFSYNFTMLMIGKKFSI